MLLQAVNLHVWGHQKTVKDKSKRVDKKKMENVYFDGIIGIEHISSVVAD
jgi:hypothetical protein